MTTAILIRELATACGVRGRAVRAQGTPRTIVLRTVYARELRSQMRATGTLTVVDTLTGTICAVVGDTIIVRAREGAVRTVRCADGHMS